MLPLRGHPFEAHRVTPAEAAGVVAAIPGPVVAGAVLAGRETDRESLVGRYRPGNPFASKAAKARLEYERLARPTARDVAMAQSFPLGVGFGRKGDEKRVDQTIDRAVKTQKALAEVQFYEASATAFDAGEINTQGRRITPESLARSEKSQSTKEKREARIAEARQIKANKESWEVTRTIYADATGYLAGGARSLVEYDHREAVESALRDGKPVPPEVLADYPDLSR